MDWKAPWSYALEALHWEEKNRKIRTIQVYKNSVTVRYLIVNYMQNINDDNSDDNNNNNNNNNNINK